jgi:hypothetical protein
MARGPLILGALAGVLALAAIVQAVPQQLERRPTPPIILANAEAEDAAETQVQRQADTAKSKSPSQDDKQTSKEPADRPQSTAERLGLTIRLVAT